MSNTANTTTLAELFATPPEQRDVQWRERFFAAAPDATLMMFDPQVEAGPDGFPYFQLAIPSSDHATTTCVAEVLGHCLDHGLGIAVFRNADRGDMPGWVFNYGQLLMYAMFGAFDAIPESPPAPGETRAPDDGGRQVLFATPSDTFFPPVVQKVMAAFLRDRLGVTEPKVTMIVDPKEWPSHGLMFNLTASQFGGDQQRYDAALGTLHWFLPDTYCAILKMPADWNDESFAPLASA